MCEANDVEIVTTAEVLAPSAAVLAIFAEVDIDAMAFADRIQGALLLLGIQAEPEPRPACRERTAEQAEREDLAILLGVLKASAYYLAGTVDDAERPELLALADKAYAQTYAALVAD